MKTLGTILGSAARTDVLHVLAHQTDPIGVRQIARLAGVYPRSAQLALSTLMRDNLVVRRRLGGHVRYTRNDDNPEALLLKALFAAAERAAIRRRNETLQQRARAILPAIRDACHLLRHTRSLKHAT